MKAALRATLTDSNWMDRLPWILLGLCSAPKEDLQSSSVELVFGQTLRVPGEFLPDDPVSGPATDCHPLFRDAASIFAQVPAHHCLPRLYMP